MNNLSADQITKKTMWHLASNFPTFPVPELAFGYDPQAVIITFGYDPQAVIITFG